MQPISSRSSSGPSVLPDVEGAGGASVRASVSSQPASLVRSNTLVAYSGPGPDAYPTTAASRPEQGARMGEGNAFAFTLGGTFPPQVAGSLQEQVRQGLLTATQAEAATASLLLGGGAMVDAYARGHLQALLPSPPLPGQPTSLTDYTSSIPGAKPEAVFEYFVQNPAAIFGAAGIVVRPAVSQLADGASLFLEERGPPPVWAPITVHLDPTTRSVHITTLDGHPLRGTNRFVFEEDGQGGTSVRQFSAFQGSSPATVVGLKLLDPIERQHDIWRQVHGHLYEKFQQR